MKKTEYKMSQQVDTTDYKQKYEQALKVASQWHKDGIGDVKTIVECIFPELKESEDEKIRNFLIDFIKVCGWTEKKDQGWPLREECIAWLEKQGEQTYIWSEEDEKKIMWLVRLISTAGYRELDNDKMPCSRNELLDWLKSLKPRWKPSEQNIKDLEWCADLVKDKMGVGFHRLQVFIDEIKNL